LVSELTGQRSTIKLSGWESAWAYEGQSPGHSFPTTSKYYLFSL